MQARICNPIQQSASERLRAVLRTEGVDGREVVRIGSSLCCVWFRLWPRLQIPCSHKQICRRRNRAERVCKLARTSGSEYLSLPALPPFPNLFFLSSLALFAFWLRSSVVSVLFSLISETTLRSRILIILIFVHRMSSLWACPWSTSTVSLVSHCLQATQPFHCRRGLVPCCEEELHGWVRKVHWSRDAAVESGRSYCLVVMLRKE